MMRPLRTAVFALTFVVCLTGCRATTPSPVTPDTVTAPQTDGAGASGLPNDVHWSRNSAEHRALILQVYRMAGEVLAAMAADLEPGTWAVALDADETVIDNSLYQKEQAARGARFDAASWGEWVKRQEAPPLPGALRFLNRIHEIGGKIAIVTNRRQEKCLDTEANFRKFSIPFDVILCRRDDKRKEARWRQVEEGIAADGLPPLEIVMWLGDNITDFPELTQDLRNQPEAAFERFGLEYFAMPNPMYGSWEDNPAN